MKKFFGTVGNAVKAAASAAKKEIGNSVEMSKEKKYLDIICDALYALPDDVDYYAIQEHISGKISEYEERYNVKYSHPFVLPNNIA